MWWGVLADAVAALGDVGVDAEVGEGRLSFPARFLPALADLPEHVTVEPTGALVSLWALCSDPPVDGESATIARAADRSLRLHWRSLNGDRDEPLDDSAVAPLMATGFGVLATHAAWETFDGSGSLSPMLGRVSANADGFCEIVTTVPQAVEAAPLRALFRLDASHFGVPAAFAGQFADLDGFVWDGQPPVLDDGPSNPTPPFRLSEHAAVDLRRVCDGLAAHHCQVLVWDTGLGRRVAAMASLAALDAWPAVVVCPPWGVWPWMRHGELSGVSVQVAGGPGDSDADVLIVSYDQVRDATVNITGRPAVILDDLPGAAGDDPVLRTSLRRAFAGTDALRIITAGDWPTEPEESRLLLSVVKPGEFGDEHTPVPARYPVDPVGRFKDHEQVYLRRRTATDTPAATGFRRSRTRLTVPSERQHSALTDLVAHGPADPRARLDAVRAICDEGAKAGMSPKVAAAVSAIREHMGRNRRVAVVCRSRRAGILMRQAARPLPLTVCETIADLDAADDSVIVVAPGVVPDLSRFDVVVFAAYPPSLTILDGAVGTAAGAHGPELVVMLHARGCLDDRLAVVAARRAALPGDGAGPWTDTEVAFLLDAPIEAVQPAFQGLVRPAVS